MTKVTLHGALALAMGRAEWEFEINQPREVIAAIEANTGKLYKYLQDAKGEYRVIINGKDHGCVQELYCTGEYDTIEIVPVPAGAGGGVWQAILGVVLIIVGVILAVYDYGAISQYVIGAGISLLLGGVAQMLAPSPKLGQSTFARQPRNMTDQLAQKREAPESVPNYLFSGAVNTTSQGNPVQIIYGEMIVGSQLVSFAITSATIDETVLGEQRPPPEDDPFFDLPVWARISAEPERSLVPSQRAVQQMRPPEVIAVATAFGIPDTFPAGDPRAGLAIPVGTPRLPRRTKKGYLSAISNLYTNTPKGITFREALDLYQVLELTSIADLPRASWRMVVLACALHFSPEP